MILQIIIFLIGLSTVIGTFYSAISTFVLPRAARSQLNRIVFGILLRLFRIPMHFAVTYKQRDAIMVYYAPVGLMLLVPTWYFLTSLGYAAIYWALGESNWQTAIRLSGSSLLTLGFAVSESFPITVFMFSEAVVGLVLVALLIAYLPTMYSAFSRREQAINLLEVRAGSPPSAVEMLSRFSRLHGLNRLAEYWTVWETWFAELEESHTVLPALVFFRSPRANNSWATAAGTVLDAAALTLAAIDIPAEPNAALSIRGGFLALRRIADYYDIPYPENPTFPEVGISVKREEFDLALDQLAAAGVPLVADREKAWLAFGGWRVNYDKVLLALCSLTMAPTALWSSDRAPKAVLPPFILPKKRK